jgi:hypothetical protein
MFRTSNNKLFTRFLCILIFILNLVLIIVLFSRLSPNDLKIYFNSEALYLPSLYRDLFIDHNPLIGWHLNPALGFFPDVIVYFILMFFSGNFILASILFSILQFILPHLPVSTT